MIRKRLPLELRLAVFTKVLQIAREHGLLKGKKVSNDEWMSPTDPDALMKDGELRHAHLIAGDRPWNSHPEPGSQQ